MWASLTSRGAPLIARGALRGPSNTSAPLMAGRTPAGLAAFVRTANLSRQYKCTPSPTPVWGGARRYLSVFSGSRSAATAAPSVGAGPAATSAVQAEVATAMYSGNHAVTAWLFTVGAACATMIVVGGITRLTKSGLSMTDWTVLGGLPPMNETEWEAEFARYKAFPEFQRNNNSTMTMKEFKDIFFWEYSHRMLGRGIGFVVVLPLAYFILRRRVKGALRNRLLFLLGIGGSQGLVGWWMVKSGLDHNAPHMQRNLNTNDSARVSPYRLATHLSFAFVIYSTTMYTAFSQLQGAVRARTPALLRVKRVVWPLSTLIGLTALSGAFVAGNDAGRVYNTFPLMDGRVIPEHIWNTALGYRNFFENLATVQFQHRCLALTTLASIYATYLHARPVMASLPPAVRGSLLALVVVGTGQVGLGICTLLQAVPVELGSAHQAGAVTLFTVVLYLMHSVKYKRVPRALLTKLAPATPK